MNEEKRLKWFVDELLPDIIRNGCFSEKGEHQTFESCDFEFSENYVSNFASAPVFASLKFRSQFTTLSHDILIKFQILNSLYRQKMRTEPQYANEANFYNQVVPCFTEFLKFIGHTPEFIEKVFPKCYYASNGEGEPEKGIVILEDLRKYGFKLSDSVMDYNLQHCFVALERLARFHALSFAMKFKKWQPFEKLKTIFEEVLLGDHPICRQQSEEFRGYICQRGIKYLLNQNNCEIPKEYLEKLREILKPIFEFEKSRRYPVEPLGVICHGDFNRNNILFRYENGEAVEAKLIDYQRVCYGSPSQDLGFIIYMNTTLEFREKHFDEIFQYYYSTLIESISSITLESKETISNWIPIQAFERDFERMALTHYITVSFFLPLMMTPPDKDFEQKMKQQTFLEMAKDNYEKGGEVVSLRLAEILLDFYRRKFYMQDVD